MQHVRRKLSAKLVVAPTGLAMLACFYAPIPRTASISLPRSGILPCSQFDGLAQYWRFLATDRWHVAFANMFIFGMLFVGFALTLGPLLAIAIDQKIRFEGFFRTILLYPLSMSFIVTGLAWQWFLNPSMGFQNLVRQAGWSDFAFDCIVQPDPPPYPIVLPAV